VSFNLKMFGQCFTARQLVERNDHYLLDLAEAK